MVCGLPDSGRVAKLIIDELVSQLKAERFAEIYSGSLPPRVILREDGTVDVPKHVLYFWKNPDSGHDIIFYTGDAQPSNPEAAYALADKALEIGQSLGAETVYTVGAYVTGEFKKDPKVYAGGTDKDLVASFEAKGVTKIDEGSITWMNGLLVGLSKLRKMNSVFLSGETSGQIIDVPAAVAVLKVLCDTLSLQIDFSELKDKAKKFEQLGEAAKQRVRSERNESGYIG